jgi:hypothetical protein
MTLKEYLFPQYTKWRIVDVFTDGHVRYCLQVRENKVTGLKQFKPTVVLDSSFTTELETLTIDNLNSLTKES